jgi:hypothetical protein
MQPCLIMVLGLLHTELGATMSKHSLPGPVPVSDGSLAGCASVCVPHWQRVARPSPSHGPESPLPLPLAVPCACPEPLVDDRRPSLVPWAACLPPAPACPRSLDCPCPKSSVPKMDSRRLRARRAPGRARRDRNMSTALYTKPSVAALHVQPQTQTHTHTDAQPSTTP